MRKLEDFGKKIGGARKDEWKNDGLCLEDLKHMNSDEKIRYVTRDNVWPLPNAKDLVENHGVEPFVAANGSARYVLFTERTISLHR